MKKLIILALLLFCFSLTGAAPPNSPTDASPASGTSNVDVDTTLSWSCTDPDADDIFYSVEFYRGGHQYAFISYASENQTGTTYNPFLFYSSTYFWRITATDENGEVTVGDWWNFSTESYSIEDDDYSEIYDDTFNTTNESLSFTRLFEGVQSAYNAVIPAGLFYLFIFGLLFGGIWIKQGDVTIPALLGLILAPLLWLYIPLEYQYACYWLFVVSIGGLIASIYKARQ